MSTMVKSVLLIIINTKKYFVDEKLCYDLTIGSKTHLFDMYWDKFRHNLKDIAYGHGRINPKLWGYQAPQKKRRK